MSKILTGRKSRSYERGSAIVDYLMITAVVAAVGAPIIMKFFGDPIRESLFNNRQELVGYLAQDRKQPVPNAWFSQEKQADIPEPAPIEVSQLEVGEIDEPGNLEVGELKDPSLKDPKDLKVGEIKEPSELKEVGAVGPGSRGGGGAGAGAGGGIASAGGDSGNLDNSFFGGDKKKGSGSGKKGEGGDAEVQAEYAEAVGGSGDVAEIVEGGGGGKKKQKGKKEDGEKDAKASDSTAKKTGLWAEEEDRRDTGLAKPFNWWILLKILIVILIIFFLAIIFMGNARRG